MYMRMCLSYTWSDLYFYYTTGWSCLWACCSKLSIGRSSNQQISSSLFALLPLLLPSPILQRKKWSGREKNPSYRTSKARHQAWLALCRRNKPTVHDCDESNNHLEVAYGNGFSDSRFLPFFCLLLHCLTYSSPRSGLLLQPIQETEKCFWLSGAGVFLVFFFFNSALCFYLCVRKLDVRDR